VDGASRISTPRSRRRPESGEVEKAPATPGCPGALVVHICYHEAEVAASERVPLLFWETTATTKVILPKQTHQVVEKKGFSILAVASAEPIMGSRWRVVTPTARVRLRQIFAIARSLRVVREVPLTRIRDAKINPLRDSRAAALSMVEGPQTARFELRRTQKQTHCQDQENGWCNAAKSLGDLAALAEQIRAKTCQTYIDA
jgi:hypothetical protein